eukprot:jgi/Botrbrau1/4896/Bobra.118_1s0010.1
MRKMEARPFWCPRGMTTANAITTPESWRRMHGAGCSGGASHPTSEMGVTVPERSNGHGAARASGGASQHSDAAAASHRSHPDSSIPLVSPNGKANSAFDMLLLALEKSENEQQGGMGGLEDEGPHYSLANSGEAAVTSRRIPSRSRICDGSLRGSIGDDASFQNAFEALRDGDELGSDGCGLTEHSPFHRFDTPPSRLPRAKHSTPRKPHLAPPLGNGGSGGIMSGSRLPLKPRNTGHSSASKLGGGRLLGSGYGRGGETNGLTVSVDSGEGETGEKVSPSGARCFSSDRQREDLGFEADGEMELDNVVTGKYQTVRTVTRQNSYANLQSNDRDPHMNVRRLQEEIKMLKEEKMKMEQELEESRTKEQEALRKAAEASLQAESTQTEILKHMHLVQRLQDESSSLASEKEAAMQMGSSHEAVLRQLQQKVADLSARPISALAGPEAQPEIDLQVRLQEALKKTEFLEEENRMMRQQLQAGNGDPAGGRAVTGLREEAVAPPPKGPEGRGFSASPLPLQQPALKAEPCSQSPSGPGSWKRPLDPVSTSPREAKRLNTAAAPSPDFRSNEKIHMDSHGLLVADPARAEGDSLQSSSTGDSGNRALMLGGPQAAPPPSLSPLSRTEPRS